MAADTVLVVTGVAIAAGETWGWDAVAALSTLGGAVGTVGALIFLYRQTLGAKDASEASRIAALAAQKTAKAAQESADAAREEASGAWRPLIVPVDGLVLHDTGADSGKASVDVTVTLENGGRGPALEIEAWLLRGDVLLTDIDGGDTNHISYAAEGRDDMVLDPRMNVGELDDIWQLQVRYTDLAGRPYWTTVDLQTNDATGRNIGGGCMEYALLFPDLRVASGRLQYPGPLGR